MRSYLRFDISGLNGRPIQQVLLRLWANTGSNRGIIVRSVNDDWSEGEVTFQNAPDPEGKSIKSGRFSGGDWITLDVTSLVKGEGSLNLILLTTDKTQSNMASRETGDHAPQLIVIASG